MADLKIIPYSKYYLNGVRALWGEQYEPNDVERREELFRWFTEGNPFLKDESPYFLALEGDTVVGLWGQMPVKYSVKGKRYDGYMSQDALLSKKYRGKGVGKVVLKEIKAQRNSFASALWFNEPNFRLYSKCGWMEVSGMYSMVKIIKPMQYFKQRNGNRLLSLFMASVVRGVNLIKKIDRNFSLSKSNNYRIEEIDNFSMQFDSFLEAVSPYFGIMVVRDSKYLNWKFVDKPFNKYKKFAAYDSDGTLCGYIVLKTDNSNSNLQPKGRILDFLAHPANPAVFDTLLNHALVVFSNSGVNFVDILCTLPSFKPVLNKRGFLKARRPHRFMINHWQNLFFKNMAGDIQEWFITLSDADGDAWN